MTGLNEKKGKTVKKMDGRNLGKKKEDPFSEKENMYAPHQNASGKNSNHWIDQVGLGKARSEGGTARRKNKKSRSRQSNDICGCKSQSKTIVHEGLSTTSITHCETQ